MSHFFAYLSRMRFIRRWGLMHNQYPENIQEHSQRVAMLAHALALIANRLYGKRLDADRLAALALYHDASEVLTGDLPSPVKYHDESIRTAYHAIEAAAKKKLLTLLPDELRETFTPYFEPADEELAEVLKAADKLCAYLKCVEELRAGNLEFGDAAKTLRAAVHEIDRPEVRYFLEKFAPSFELTLDELNTKR